MNNKSSNKTDNRIAFSITADQMTTKDGSIGAKSFLVGQFSVVVHSLVVLATIMHTVYSQFFRVVFSDASTAITRFILNVVYIL